MGYANLAALPSPVGRARGGVLWRTDDGGAYESDGTTWLEVRAPSGTYAPLTKAQLLYHPTTRTPKSPSPATITATLTDAGSLSTERVPLWVDRNGRLWGKRNGSNLIYSDDDGATWSADQHFFPNGGIDSVRDLDDGEFLVGIRGQVQATDVNTPGTVYYARLFRSAGANYGTTMNAATWSIVLQSEHGYNNFEQRMIDGLGSVWVAATYGPTTSTRALVMASDGGPWRAWLSEDMGKTWAVCYDLRNFNSTNYGSTGAAHTNMWDNDHTHGVCYDPWEDRIWIANGDTNDGVRYSEDHGKTWTLVVKEQPTVVTCNSEALIFTSDHSPNGVYTLPRFTRGQDPSFLFNKLAYRIDTSGGVTVVGVTSARGNDGAIYLAYAVVAGQNDGARLIATRDGYNFYEIWHDPATVVSGSNVGFEQITGPTKNGLLHGYLDATTTHFSPNKTYWKATAPTWQAKDAPASPPVEYRFLSGDAAATSWASMPSALTELLGVPRDRRQVDLTNATQVRINVLTTTIATAGSGATLALQYSPDGGTTWKYTDGSDGTVQAPSGAYVAIDAGTGTVVKKSVWVTIAAAAKADCMWRVVGQSSTSAGSPGFASVTMQAKA